MSPVAAPRASAGSDLEIRQHVAMVSPWNCVSLNRKRGWPTTFNPNGLGHNEITTRHTYSREDCGHNDPSMSPSSRPGRGAMTLTPAPNGAKAFNMACL